jgi:hypothetical protein
MEKIAMGKSFNTVYKNILLRYVKPFRYSAMCLVLVRSFYNLSYNTLQYTSNNAIF